MKDKIYKTVKRPVKTHSVTRPDLTLDLVWVDVALPKGTCLLFFFPIFFPVLKE